MRARRAAAAAVAQRHADRECPSSQRNASGTLKETVNHVAGLCAEA